MIYICVPGNALIKCGETQRRIGGAHRELVQTGAINFLTPLRNFIEGDYKTISVSMGGSRQLLLCVASNVSLFGILI